MKKMIFLLFAFLPSFVFAWGNRGHHTVCEAAVYLVKEKGMREFLQGRPHVMGHLCNVPDIYWKSIGSPESQLGNYAHYVDADILGVPFKDIPTDYKAIVTKYTGQTNAYNGKKIFSVPTEFGSNWWRADQFYRRGVAAAKLLKEAPAPTNQTEEQNNNLPYNKNIFDFFVNLGIMGHFVGDNAQPFHLTANYDGFKTGHGGIHGYYEEAVVDVLPYDLVAKVVQQGQQFQKWAASKNPADRKKAPFLKAPSVVEKMKALGEISFSEIDKVLALDKVKKPSTESNEKGMSIKVRAEREAPEVTAPKFQKLIETQMGRAASLLAELWNEAYIEAGRPDLKGYRSYLYPFTPEFVPPDYYETKDLGSKEK